MQIGDVIYTFFLTAKISNYNETVNPDTIDFSEEKSWKPTALCANHRLRSYKLPTFYCQYTRVIKKCQ